MAAQSGVPSLQELRQRVVALDDTIARARATIATIDARLQQMRSDA